MKEKYIVLTDISTESDRPVWTLTASQLDSIVRLMMESNSDEMRDLGLSIGRAYRVIASKVDA